MFKMDFNSIICNCQSNIETRKTDFGKYGSAIFVFATDKLNMVYLTQPTKHRKNCETALTPGIPSISGIPGL